MKKIILILLAPLIATASNSAAPKSYSYALSATQHLFNGGNNIFNLLSAYASLKYQEASLKATQATVLYNVRAAFLELLTR